MDRRKAIEKEFHDRLRTVNDDPLVADTRWSPDMEETIRSNPLWANMKYYSIEKKSRSMVQEWLKQNCQGKRVLDYCCGNGEDSRFIAKNGAKEVIGIDISDISIKNCKEKASENDLEPLALYLVRDAESTGFEDNSFDIITEYGALHHLDLEKAFGEMARLLRPEGKIICNEALCHNPIISLYRKLTPNLRTKWEAEHILGKKDLHSARKYFKNIEFHFFHLFTLLAVPFRTQPFFERLLSFLGKVDDFLLKLPLIKWQAWQVVFVLSDPIKRKRREISTNP